MQGISFVELRSEDKDKLLLEQHKILQSSFKLKKMEKLNQIDSFKHAKLLI